MSSLQWTVLFPALSSLASFLQDCRRNFFVFCYLLSMQSRPIITNDLHRDNCRNHDPPGKIRWPNLSSLYNTVCFSSPWIQPGCSDLVLAGLSGGITGHWERLTGTHTHALRHSLSLLLRFLLSPSQLQSLN